LSSDEWASWGQGQGCGSEKNIFPVDSWSGDSVIHQGLHERKNGAEKYLVGGFKHSFYFRFHIWDVILPIDFHIFQDGYCTTTRYTMIYFDKL